MNVIPSFGRPPIMAAVRRDPKKDQQVVEEEPPSLRIGKYTRLNEIGRGSFATVYRGTHNEYNTFVAVKTVSLVRLNRKLKDNLKLEINILKSLHHPHIVSLLDCYDVSSHIHLVMEFCALGDLSHFIRKRNSMARHELLQNLIMKYPNPPGDGLNEVIVRHFLKQLASALGFLRASDLIHRDVKPQNMLLHPSPSMYAKSALQSASYQGSEDSFTPIAGVSSLPMLKIADFGFARSLPNTSLADTLCGSPLYMAPEILRYEKYDAKADLWSVGAVLYEMVVGKPPFRANNHIDLIQKIQSGKDKIRFPRDADVSADVKQLIRGLLKSNPVERMTFSDFFEDSVVAGDIPRLVGEDLKEQNVRNAKKDLKEIEQTSGQNDRKEVLNEERTAKHNENAPASPTTSIPAQASPRLPLEDGSHRSSTMRRVGSREMPDTQRAIGAGRRSSGVSQTSPLIQQETLDDAEQGERQRGRKVTEQIPDPKRSSYRRKTEGISEKEKERAAQDIVFERDYVVVEKRAVEVNALADELAASPQLRQQRQQLQQQYKSNSHKSGSIVRRATTTATPSKAIQDTHPDSQAEPSRIRPELTHKRRSSYDRRYGPNTGSSGSAISRAINMASGRLFGIGFSPPTLLSRGGRSPPLGYSPFPSYPIGQSSLVVVEDETRPQRMDEDSKTLNTIEEYATRSDVAYGFAEVKYKQLIPSTPSTRSDATIKPVRSTTESNSHSPDPNEYGLTIDAVVTLSEEALVLYVKALSLVATSMNIAGAWWARKTRGEVIEDGGSSRTDTNNGNVAVINRINNVVQWNRNRFNEVLQKAEYSGRRLLDAQKQLPSDHPYHINQDTAVTESIPAFDQSADQISVRSGITAEKLMYDRALEMSRTAAINELTGEDLPGCEIAYVTAIRMLEAVLESDEVQQVVKDVTADRASNEHTPDENGAQIEDGEVVSKLVESVRTRLRALRKKMALLAKRTSAPPATYSPRIPGSHARSASPAKAQFSSK